MRNLLPSTDFLRNPCATCAHAQIHSFNSRSRFSFESNCLDTDKVQKTVTGLSHVLSHVVELGLAKP